MTELTSKALQKLLELRSRAKGVSTDTRADLRDQIFIALQGANFDGNTFVNTALTAGALHAITSDVTLEGHPNVTVVQDTLQALHHFARAYRNTWSCPVLAMTGSNGKTTTKELIRDVMATKFQVHATPGNFNNHIGVPLTLLNAPARPEFVVVEMGANHQKEIETLAQIALPCHGYITNIGLAHLEGFGGEDGVYRGKKELFDHLKRTKGTAFVQSSDAKVMKAAEGIAHQVEVPHMNWSWKALKQGGAMVSSPQGDTFPVNLEGRYNLSNVIAALTIGKHFGVPAELAISALSQYIPVNHRSQAVETAHNWVLLDAYNANPSSMAHAVGDFLERHHPHPLLILGDMAELGDVSAQAHENLVAIVAKSEAALWTVGKWFGKVHARAPRPGWTHFSRCEDALTHLEETPLRGRQILIKGSRSIGLERLMPNL